MEDLPWWMETKARRRFGMWSNNLIRILRVRKFGDSGSEIETWTLTKRPRRTRIDWHVGLTCH